MAAPEGFCEATVVFTMPENANVVGDRPILSFDTLTPFQTILSPYPGGLASGAITLGLLNLYPSFDPTYNAWVALYPGSSIVFTNTTSNGNGTMQVTAVITKQIAFAAVNGQMNVYSQIWPPVGPPAPYVLQSTTPSDNFVCTFPCPVMNLTPTTLPNATRNLPYPNQVITINGGGATPFNINAIVGLPSGITASYDNNAGTITLSSPNVTSTSGNYPFTISGVDANLCLFTQNFNLHICDLQILPASMPNGVVGTPYVNPIPPITASNGDAPYLLIASGDAIPGLTFAQISATQGKFNGIPTTPGTYNFTITATDSEAPEPCTGFQNYTIVVVKKKKRGVPRVVCIQNVVGDNINFRGTNYQRLNQGECIFVPTRRK